MNLLRITVYSKRDCHLCDEAKGVLKRFAASYPLQINEQDIESDPALFEKFHDEIPVIFLENRKLFKYRIDEKKFRKAIEAALKEEQ